MKAKTSEELKLFYRRALARLSPEERERERGRDIPYEFSLSVLSSFFFETGIRQGWLSSGNPLVVAVSGGSDSMALLWLFRVFYEGGIVAAHFEHGIRGSESMEDALFVKDMAGRWGIETAVRHEDVPRSLEKGESLEAGARRLRYLFFERTAEERGACGVALGHNREDVAETALFHLLRGTGVRGLAGIPERRGIFFRPLLACSRAFLRRVLRYRDIPWREDRTNQDNRHTRNFIRNKLLPSIESGVNVRAVEHLAAFAEEMRYYREEEERRGSALIEAAGAVRVNDGLDLNRAVVSALPLRERIILIRETGRRLEIPVLSRERCLELALLTEGRRRFEFQCGKGACIMGDRDRIKLRKAGSGAE
ncbi:MAG: tRNA lysidine(34) synthetase TilS [Synergistaceae bacterium]|nr:tRNA lysidine(34) synthetase TilS [Synergistaceae bacterium]